VEEKQMKMKFVCGIALAATLAVTGSVAAAERGRDGEVKLIYWQAPSTMNPYLSGGGKELEASSVVIEALARYDPSGNLVPWLVDEIPTVENGGVSKDLMSITWEISEGVKWSDGTPLTSADVSFTYDYCTHPDTGCTQSNYYNDIASIETPDDRTVKINFTVAKPFPYAPFVSQQAPIIQKAQFEGCIGAKAHECTDQNFYPIGTGGFKVKDFKPNDVIIFEANENYRVAGKPAFQTVVFKGGGDAVSSARAVLETGEFDYAWNLQVAPEILTEMEKKGKGKVISAFGTYVERLMVNFTNPDPALGENRSEYMDGNNPHPFLSDYAVRRALSLAIERQILVDAGYGQAGVVACNVLSGPEIYRSTERRVQNPERRRSQPDSR